MNKDPKPNSLPRGVRVEPCMASPWELQQKAMDVVLDWKSQALVQHAPTPGFAARGQQ